jgi:hypothetical protein
MWVGLNKPVATNSGYEIYKSGSAQPQTKSVNENTGKSTGKSDRVEISEEAQRLLEKARRNMRKLIDGSNDPPMIRFDQNV